MDGEKVEDLLSQDRRLPRNAPVDATACSGALKGLDRQTNLEETLDTKCTPKSQKLHVEAVL